MASISINPQVGANIAHSLNVLWYGLIIIPIVIIIFFLWLWLSRRQIRRG